MYGHGMLAKIGNKNSAANRRFNYHVVEDALNLLQELKDEMNES
jgi:hypothetical protein